MLASSSRGGSGNHPDPIVDLKLLKNRNFGTAVFLQLILGMVLFGTTVLIPQYLQGLLGYTAERAGMVAVARRAW